MAFASLPFLFVVEGDVPGIEAPNEAVSPDLGGHDSVIDLVLSSGPVVQGVLWLLVIMSIVTWAIVFFKWFQVRSAKTQSKRFSDVFWGSRNLAQISETSIRLKASPVAKVFAAGHKELAQILKSDKPQGDFGELENIDRALKRAKAEELTRLENGNTFLATTASAAPFIGLFGTVWGIMNAFLGLSKTGASTIQAVAPGISEALIATAIGLGAAIPAAIFFNYFTQQIRVLSRNMDMFSAEFLNIARRHFLK